MGRRPSTALTRGMVYLETSDGIAEGDASHSASACSLAKIAIMADDGRALALTGEWCIAGRWRNGVWAAAVVRQSERRSALLARGKVDAVTKSRRNS